MKNRIDKKTHIYRCYVKHFHPDKFVGHPAHSLTEDLLKLIHMYRDEGTDGFEEFVISTGLRLKSVLNSDR